MASKSRRNDYSNLKLLKLYKIWSYPLISYIAGSLWTTVPVSVYQIAESLLTRQLTAFTDTILQLLQIEAISVI